MMATISFALLLVAQTVAQTPSVDEFDPLSVHGLASRSQLGSFDVSGPGSICRFDEQNKQPLSLADVVDRALCNNPQTRAAWANAVANAAQVGVTRAAYLPTLSVNASDTGVRTTNNARTTVGGVSAPNTTGYTQQTAGANLNYVLYDFGIRAANLENNMQTLVVANYLQEATLQSVFLSALQSYYQLFSARAALESMKEAERSSSEGLVAATARFKAGATSAFDQLQAQTAYSTAVLNRKQAEASVRIAQGALATAMGLDANTTLEISSPDVKEPDDQFDRDLSLLIDAARKRRPDLASAEAQVKAARANVDVAKAQGWPTIALSASGNYVNSDSFNSFHTGTLGVTITFPLFTGFNRTYQIQTFQAQLDNSIATRDTLRIQVAFDVWQAYYNLDLGTQTVRGTGAIVANAVEAERVALARYKLGAGIITDLLSAQLSLASARLQNIQALYNWYIARAALARSMGQLDLAQLESIRSRK
jgi:TolC family type I secretion outer membrane protein